MIADYYDDMKNLKLIIRLFHFLTVRKDIFIL